MGRDLAVVLPRRPGFDELTALVVGNGYEDGVSYDGISIGVGRDIEPGSDVVGRRGRCATAQPLDLEPGGTVLVDAVVGDSWKGREVVLIADSDEAARL